MKNNILRIGFQCFDDFKSEVEFSLRKKEKLIQPKNKIIFDSVASFRKFMTLQKLEILAAIFSRKPSSIYGLASLVGRDFSAVLRDCISLEKTGFIFLEKMKDPKNKKIPRLSFKYDIISISIPNAGYKIEFSKAA